MCKYNNFQETQTKIPDLNVISTSAKSGSEYEKGNN